MDRFFNAIKELVWPEGIGVLLGIGLHWLSRGIDYQQGWNKAFRRMQDIAAVVAGLGSAYVYSSTAGNTKEVMRGLFSANVTLVGEGLADGFWTPEEAFGTKGKRPVSQQQNNPRPAANFSPRTQRNALQEGRSQRVSEDIVEEYPTVYEEELIT